MASIDVTVRDEVTNLDGNPLTRGIEILQRAILRQRADHDAQIRRSLIIAGTKLGPLQYQWRIFHPDTVPTRGHRRAVVVDDGARAVLTAHCHRQRLGSFNQSIVHGRQRHGKAGYPGRHSDLACGAVVGHPIAELCNSPIRAGCRIGTAALNSEVILGRLMGLVRQGHRMREIAAFLRVAARDRLYDWRHQWFGCKGSQAGITIRIHYLDLEVDITVAKRPGHVLVLEELPLAGGRGKFQTEHQGTIAGFTYQGIGRFHGGGDQLAGCRGQAGFVGAEQLHIALAISPPLRCYRA